MQAKSNKVRTRFAPSPTGFFHIGGARTALINWIFSKHIGGDFLLRIEDTDYERNKAEAANAIMEGLDWLNIRWDGDIIHQSNRLDRHKEVAFELLKQGKAYICLCPPVQEGEYRKAYCECRNMDCTDKKGAIKLKTDYEGESIINDLIKKEVRFKNSELGDWVMLRPDLTPTYMLSVVVDDHDMNITHVIRGDDHLINTPRQIQLYKAMDWDIPSFAHIPLILNEDGSKMSKRHSLSNLNNYKSDYLSESIVHYLLTLGMSWQDERKISIENAVNEFNFKKIRASASRFDQKKLLFINKSYIKDSDNKDLMQICINSMEDIKFHEDNMKKLEDGLDCAKKRANSITGMIDLVRFLFHFQKDQFSEGDKAILMDLYDLLSNPDYSISDFAKGIDQEMKYICSLLRRSMTGHDGESLSINEIIRLLGIEEARERIKQSAV